MGESNPGRSPFVDRIQPHQDVSTLGSQWIHHRIQPATRAHTGTDSEHFPEDTYHDPDVNPLWGDHDEDDEDSHPEFSNILKTFYLRGGNHESVSEAHRRKELAHFRRHFDSPIYGSKLYGNTRLSNHELYDRHFNNWKLSEAGQRAEQEGLDANYHGDIEDYLRERHMEDAQREWKSDELHPELGRRRGMGELDYYFGLEWLSPEDRIAVYDHLMNPESDHVMLSDGMKLPRGRLVANFHQRYSPVHSHHTRDVDATGESFVGRLESDVTQPIDTAKLYDDFVNSAVGQKLINFYQDRTGNLFNDTANKKPSLKLEGNQLKPDKEKTIKPSAIYAMANINHLTKEPYRPLESPHYENLTRELIDELGPSIGQEIYDLMLPHEVAKNMANYGRGMRNDTQAFLQPLLAIEGKNAHHHSYTEGSNESFTHHFAKPFMGRGGLGKTHATRLATMHDTHNVAGRGLLTQTNKIKFNLPQTFSEFDEFTTDTDTDVLAIPDSAEGIMAPFSPPDSALAQAVKYIKEKGGTLTPKEVAEISPDASMAAALNDSNTYVSGKQRHGGGKTNVSRKATTNSPKQHNKDLEGAFADGLERQPMLDIYRELHASAYDTTKTIGYRHAHGAAQHDTGMLKRDEQAAERQMTLAHMLSMAESPANPRGMHNPSSHAIHPHDDHPPEDGREELFNRDEHRVLQGTHGDTYDKDLKQLYALREEADGHQRKYMALLADETNSKRIHAIKEQIKATDIFIEGAPDGAQKDYFSQRRNELQSEIDAHEGKVTGLRVKANNAEQKLQNFRNDPAKAKRMYAYQSAEDNYNSLIEQQESGIPVDEEELEEAKNVLDGIERTHYGRIDKKMSRHVKERADTHHSVVKGHVDAIENEAKSILESAKAQGFDLFSMAPPDTVMAWAMYQANKNLATQDHNYHGQMAPVAGDVETELHPEINQSQDSVKQYILGEQGHEVTPNEGSYQELAERIFGEDRAPYHIGLAKKLATMASNSGKPIRVASVKDLISNISDGAFASVNPSADTIHDEILSLMRFPVDTNGDFSLSTERQRGSEYRTSKQERKRRTRSANNLNHYLANLTSKGLKVITPNPMGKKPLNHHYTNKVDIPIKGDELVSERRLYGLADMLHGVVVDDGSVEHNPEHRARKKNRGIISKPIGHAGSHESEATIMSLYNSDGMRTNYGHVHDVPFRLDIKDGRMVFSQRRTPKKMRLVTPMGGSTTRVLPSEHHGHFGLHNVDTGVERQPNSLRSNSVGRSFNDDILAPSTKMDGPALLASLTNPDYIRKDMPEGLPSLQPMHRIFDIDDLEHLRGFTGDWIVSAYPEGKRMFVTKKDDKVESKGSLTDEEKKAFKQVSDKDFVVDVIRTDKGLYIFEVVEFDDKEVHDIPIQDRIKLLRGALESVEGIDAPSASDTKLTDDVGLADAIKNIDSDRVILRDAKSTYMKGEARHPKWVLYQKGNDVTLMVLERRGESPYVYRLGTGPIIHGEDLGDRAVKIEDDIYMDIGASFNSPDKYEVGDYVKVNVSNVTEGHASENQKVYTVHAPQIEGEAEGEPLVSTESLAMLAKADFDQSPLSIYRSDRHIRVSFEAGDVLYKATTRGQYWTVHTPVADNGYLIRLAESQRPFWSPVAGVMLKGDFSIEEREDKAEVHESKNDGKPLIPPKKIEGTGTWDKEKVKVMKKSAELLEKLLSKSGIGQVGMSSAGPKGLGIDVGTPIQSPTGPTNPDDAKTMPDYDVRDVEREKKDKEEESKDVEEVDSKLELTEDKAVYHI